MRLWRDKLFWSLFLGGLASYLLAILGGYSSAVLLGDFLWLSAFVYLTASFLRKNSGELAQSR
ncbi:hypothetical protein [Thermococcus sp.]|uniref:hypothetical protein n=1 Tax=Thermococcus sp. TaxID=35749 RepID=UPI0025F2E382|nr:hypothetical protein [Thermococcus sp.]